MNNREHILLCIMAESAAGKDKLANQLCEREGFSQLISYTTRERRVNEGETHVFVSEDEYYQMLEDKQIAAHTIVNNYHYWCTIDQLYTADVYIIDPMGLQTLKALNLPNLHIITIYINVPAEVRQERALTRGDHISVYRSRCLSERQQFRDMKKNMDVDYVLPNIDFAKAYSCLKYVANIEGLWKNKIGDRPK